MIRKARRFPLVADNEILIGANPVMSLYDESDLISNIKGPVSGARLRNGYRKKEVGSR